LSVETSPAAQYPRTVLQDFGEASAWVCIVSVGQPSQAQHHQDRSSAAQCRTVYMLGLQAYVERHSHATEAPVGLPPAASSSQQSPNAVPSSIRSSSHSCFSPATASCCLHQRVRNQIQGSVETLHRMNRT